MKKNTLRKEAASRDVGTEIAKAKSKYRNKTENQYVNGDLRSAWQGIKSMAAINHCNETKQSKWN